MTDIIILAYSGELIPTNLQQNTVSTGVNDDIFDKMIAGKYLPRMQLMTSNSVKCKDGSFPVNHYALVVGNTYVDLGREVDVLVCAMRYKALDTSNDAIVAIYDPQSPEWASIADRADNTQDSGCMYGPEFMFYIPAVQKFGSFLMGSKSSRKVAPDVKACQNKAATLGSQLAKKGTYSWMVPTCRHCSVAFDLPALEILKEEIAKFANPPASEVEAAPAQPTGRER